ncbi:hypothetical protein [Ekhidna sp.]|jgi:hypothetical protein|uniref:hypothetical protein n=1 Tax=Ekhidna sp. TaxID=2608089 RepID=UPI0032EB9439
MRKLLLIPLGFIAFFSALYLADQYNKENYHPTLNEYAEVPDRHLINSIEQYFRNEIDKSLESMEQAIEAIWILEKDMNGVAAIRAEEVAANLEQLHKQMVEDSIDRGVLLMVFEYSMNNLAYAEIVVSQEYANSSQTSKAKRALHFAKSHLLNNNIFFERIEDSPKTLINRMDSLLKMDEISDYEYLSLLKEIDRRNQKIESSIKF